MFTGLVQGAFASGRRLGLAGIVMTGMLGLLLLQLTWWLIFFEIRHDEYNAVRKENDFLREAIANEEIPRYLPDGREITEGLERRDGAFVASADRLEARREAHRRRRFMLISETIFLMCVLIYGHYRVIRALLREWRLVKDRNNLIQSVTHELKTPLAAASLHLQTLRKRNLPEEQRAQLLDESIADLRRLEERINNLLTGSALLRGQPTTSEKARDTNADAVTLLENYRSENAAYLRERSVELIVTAPEQMPVRLDAALLEKVISNLIQNAVQHSPAGERVRVELEQDPGSRRLCILRVRDAGPGIPAEERERVFQPLVRLEHASTDYRGSGMGLYIVREILNAAGGSIRLDEAPGGGLVAEARLPRA
jgi:signal transduction histidine kinase